MPEHRIISQLGPAKAAYAKLRPRLQSKPSCLFPLTARKELGVSQLSAPNGGGIPSCYAVTSNKAT